MKVTCFDDCVVLGPRQRIALDSVRPLKVGPYAIRTRLNFRLFVKDNSADRVQCNRIPYQLKAMLVPFRGAGFTFQELSGSIGAVDFETIVFAYNIAVRRMANWKAEVVQGRWLNISLPS